MAEPLPYNCPLHDSTTTRAEDRFDGGPYGTLDKSTRKYDCGCEWHCEMITQVGGDLWIEWFTENVLRTRKHMKAA